MVSPWGTGGDAPVDLVAGAGRRPHQRLGCQVLNPLQGDETSTEQSSAIVGGGAIPRTAAFEVDAPGIVALESTVVAGGLDALGERESAGGRGEGEPLGTDGAKEAGDGSASDRAIAGKAVRPVVVVVLLHDAIETATLGPRRRRPPGGPGGRG